MGSAISPAIDYLLTNLPAALEAVDSSVAVCESWPIAAADDYFIIGRAADTDQESTAGTYALTLLGGELVDEEFVIPCFIDCFRGGTDQSEARQAALAYLDAFVKFLASDRTLGGVLLNGRYARMDAVRIEGTSPEDAPSGRRCQVQFSIRCQNQYSPFA